MAHVAGERRHIVRRVGKFQHRLTDNLARRFGAEPDGVVAAGRDHGELFDDEPVEICTLNLLPRAVIEDEGAKVAEPQRRLRPVRFRVISEHRGNLVAQTNLGHGRRDHGAGDVAKSDHPIQAVGKDHLVGRDPILRGMGRKAGSAFCPAPMSPLKAALWRLATPIAWR